MSYHIYTTEGLVLSLRTQREFDKTAYIFTKDLGLVVAGVRGIRTMKSKVAPFLTELSLIKVSLVRGKRSWRVTSVSLVRNFGTELRSRFKYVELMNRVVRLVSTFVHGEEKNAELFDELSQGFNILFDSTKEEDLDLFEIFLVSRVLSHLGYMSKDDLPTDLSVIRDKKSHFLKLVNTSIESSGLR